MVCIIISHYFGHFREARLKRSDFMNASAVFCQNQQPKVWKLGKRASAGRIPQGGTEAVPARRSDGTESSVPEFRTEATMAWRRYQRFPRRPQSISVCAARRSEPGRAAIPMATRPAPARPAVVDKEGRAPLPARRGKNRHSGKQRHAATVRFRASAAHRTFGPPSAADPAPNARQQDNPARSP
jgi:hypothetical protein